MTSATAPAIDQRLQGMAGLIRQRIPGAEVGLYSCGEACGYGSRARGTAGPESDIDLLITAPDAWLEGHQASEKNCCNCAARGWSGSVWKTATLKEGTSPKNAQRSDPDHQSP